MTVRRVLLGLAGAAGLLAAGCGGEGEDGSEVEDAVAPPAAAASCVETYSAEALARRAFAFDGTIVSVELREDPTLSDSVGETAMVPWVTFDVNRWYKGGSGEQVGIWVEHLGTPTSAGAIGGEPGARLLVTGEPRWGGEPLEDPIAWPCGFTQPYSEGAAAEWEDAFGTNEPGPSAAACAFEVSYMGHTYVSSGIGVSPIEGRPLGTAQLPPCSDTGDPEDGAPGQEIEVAEVQGVPPTLALAWQGHPETVLIRTDADYDNLPAALERLLTAPACDSGNEPIELAGPWLGIVGGDGNTEVDLVPPYTVALHVEESSAPAYERAYLTIHVPRGLEPGLTRADIRDSLWAGGTISVTARCHGARYVAEQVAAYLPAR
jgi:hypothetical protein